MQKKETPVVTEAQRSFIGNSEKSTASKVRFLRSEGYEKADVARILGIRYQWVKNVLDKEKGG